MTGVFLSDGAHRTEQIGRAFAKDLKEGDFVALYGGLGAGKTTFTKGVVSFLCPSARVSSPTFTIANEYEGETPVFHFDAYRLENERDLYGIGFDDYFDRNGIIIVEWIERIPGVLPDEYYKVVLSADGGERKIDISKVKK